jgi:antitoxin (DNA-binding transcriptional repressor) of toxin-antitoxin stability system
MTIVERRTFQRNPAAWLHRAEAGEEIVIQSRGRPPLTLRAGKPAGRHRSKIADWAGHFRWVRSRAPMSVDEFNELIHRDR